MIILATSRWYQHNLEWVIFLEQHLAVVCSCLCKAVQLFSPVPLELPKNKGKKNQTLLHISFKKNIWCGSLFCSSIYIANLNRFYFQPLVWTVWWKSASSKLIFPSIRGAYLRLTFPKTFESPCRSGLRLHTVDSKGHIWAVVYIDPVYPLFSMCSTSFEEHVRRAAVDHSKSLKINVSRVTGCTWSAHGARTALPN